MAWVKFGINTNASADDKLEINTATNYKLMMGMVHIFNTGGTTSLFRSVDNNTATDYADRHEKNGTMSSNINGTGNEISHGTAAEDQFAVFFGCNLDSEEKLFVTWGVQNNGAGASNVADKIIVHGKVDTTTNTGQFTDIDVDNTGTGDYDTDSNLSVIASN